MKAERWQKVNDLFQSAAERAPEERAAFLEEACHGDEGLRRKGVGKPKIRSGADPLTADDAALYCKGAGLRTSCGEMREILTGAQMRAARQCRAARVQNA